MTRPVASSAEALLRMQRQRRRDTTPELALRRQLHRLGLRYRVDRRVLPALRRRADAVFVGAKVAVFVDGCFWHSCPQHATLPRANADWWVDKLAHNVRRDRDTDRRLADEGWLAVRVWEHEDMADAAGRIRDLVHARRVDGFRFLRRAAERLRAPVRDARSWTHRPVAPAGTQPAPPGVDPSAAE